MPACRAPNSGRRPPRIGSKHSLDTPSHRRRAASAARSPAPLFNLHPHRQKLRNFFKFCPNPLIPRNAGLRAQRHHLQLPHLGLREGGGVEARAAGAAGKVFGRPAPPCSAPCSPSPPLLLAWNPCIGCAVPAAPTRGTPMQLWRGGIFVGVEVPTRAMRCRPRCPACYMPSAPASMPTCTLPRSPHTACRPALPPPSPRSCLTRCSRRGACPTSSPTTPSSPPARKVTGGNGAQAHLFCHLFFPFFQFLLPVSLVTACAQGAVCPHVPPFFPRSHPDLSRSPRSSVRPRTPARPPTPCLAAATAAAAIAGAQWEKAAEVFEQMQAAGCRPDVVSGQCVVVPLSFTCASFLHAHTSTHARGGLGAPCTSP